MPAVARFCFLFLASVFACAQSPLESKAKVVALVFVSSECPISNRLAPELERLYRKFPTNDVHFCLVYPNQTDTTTSIHNHRESYRLSAPFIADPQHELVKKSLVTITPEAAVFDAKRALVYRGRITDQFLSLGRARPEPSTHDLEDAIRAVLAGRSPKEPLTKAVGCYIEDK